MSKERKRSTIVKPSIDYATILRFAEAGASTQADPAGNDGRQSSDGPNVPAHKGQIPLTVVLKDDVHAALQREATRKGRTIEELVRKVLTKHCKSD